MNFSIILMVLLIKLAQQPRNCAGMLNFANRLFTWRISSSERPLLSDSGQDLLDSEGFVHFKIERFSKFLWQDWSAIKATKISSEPILIKGLSWKLIVRFFYYNKDEFCDPWHLGIFVQCDGEPGAYYWFHASVTFRVLSLKEHKWDFIWKLNNQFHNGNNNQGKVHMLNVGDLFKPKNGWYDPKDDCIIVEAHIKIDSPPQMHHMLIFCTIRPNYSACNQQIVTKVPYTIKKGINDLFENGNGADVKFLIGPKESEKKLISSNKAVLIAASDVFAAMFRFREEQNQNMEIIELEDDKFDAFKILLTYIHTGYLSGLNLANLYDFLYAANKYNIENVIQICTTFMQLDLDNVLNVLMVAHFFEIKPLVNRCWSFIDQNVHDVIEKDEFLDIDQEMLSELLVRDQLMTYRKPWKGGEMALWKALDSAEEVALRWADEQCRQRGLEISAQNRRQMLGPALYKIRFALIKRKDFMREIVPTGILTQDELSNLYKNCSNPADQRAIPADVAAIILPINTRA